MRIITPKGTDPIKVFSRIEGEGFEWSGGGSVLLFVDEYWFDEPDAPMVSEPCPECGRFYDQTFNATNTKDGVCWFLHSCMDCGAIWFDRVED